MTNDERLALEAIEALDKRIRDNERMIKILSAMSGGALGISVATLLATLLARWVGWL